MERKDNESGVWVPASPVQGAASITDLVQAKQGEPARRMVELTQGAASAPACPNAAHMGEHACANRSQCWEPCGVLGKSAEHCKVAAASAISRSTAAEGQWTGDTAASALDPVAEILIDAGHSKAEAVALAAESRARIAASAPDCPKCGASENEECEFRPFSIHICERGYDKAAASATDQGAASTAKQRYDRHVAGCEEEISPIERLRFFCSLAMRSQDWLDSEAFFDAALAERAQAAQPTTAEQALRKLCDSLEGMKRTMFLMPGTGQHYSYLLWEDASFYVEEARKSIATPAPEQEAAPKAKRFEAWWEEHGQFVRAGGGDYEKCFAYAAWNYAAPVEQEAAQVVAKADDLSHVVPPFAATAGQHDWISTGERLPEQRGHAYQVVAICAKKYGDNTNYPGQGKRGVQQDWVVRRWPQNFVAWMYLPPFSDQSAASGAREGRDAQDEGIGKGCATATNTNQPEGAGESE